MLTFVTLKKICKVSLKTKKYENNNLISHCSPNTLKREDEYSTPPAFCVVFQFMKKEKKQNN